jgi:hypothetical protein
MSKKHLIAIIALSLLFSLTSTIFAQETTPSPSTGDSKNPSLEDVQKIREAVQEKVAEKLKTLTTTTSNKKAFIGQISQIDNLNFTLNYQNKDYLLTVDPETVYINEKLSRSNIDQLKVGQEILAMGILNESQTLDTKRIIAIKIDSLKNENKVISGIIVDISQTANIFSLSPFTDKDSQYQVKYDAKTQVYSYNKKVTKFSELKPGQRIAIVGSLDENNSKSLNSIKIFQLDPPPSPTPTSTPETQEN